MNNQQAKEFNLDDGILFEFRIVYGANSVDNIIAYRSVVSMASLIQYSFMHANEMN